MKHITRFIALSAAVFLFAACGVSAPSTTITSQRGTAKIIFAEAEKFVKQTYPQAVFIGYNNHDATTDRFNSLSTHQTVTGESDVWFHFFAKNPEMISDKVVSDSDAVAVKFEKGKLTLWETVTMRDYDLSDYAVTGADLLKEDTDAIVAKVFAGIDQAAGAKQTPIHVDWRMLPGIAEVTVFTSATAGFDAKYDYKTGEVSYVRAVSFN